MSPTRIEPASGCSWPTIMRNSVVLPAPFGPITPTMPPGGSLNSRPLISSAPLIALREVLGLQHHAAKPRARGDLDLRAAHLVAARLLGELLISRNTRLALGLPRLRARPDPLQLARHGALLGLVLAALLRRALGLLLQPARIIALVRDALAAIEFQRPTRDAVEEVAVVGDEDHAAGIVFEVMLQPVGGLGVEMVGRLVEQQDVRPRQQQLRQRHAPPLAAGQVLHARMRRRAVQRLQRLLHLRVEVPQILAVDDVLQPRHLVGVSSE